MLSAFCDVYVARLSDNPHRLALASNLVDSNAWHSEYSLSLDLANALEGPGCQCPDRVEVCVRVPASQAWYLTSDRRLERLNGPVTPPAPVGRFVVVHNDHGLFKLDFPWAPRLSLRLSGPNVEIRVIVQDAESCGLLIHDSEKRSAAPISMDLTVLRDRLSSLSECFWLEPYPDGARAAICLTDHADFDTVGKLRPIVDLFTQNEFKITKSIFPQSDPINGKREPGLDDPDYLKLVHTLHEAGSEIALHGFGPRRDAPSREGCVRRLKAAAPFAPQTWIDHGSGRYLFVREGYLDDGTRLTDILDQFGVRNYWSYTDIWDNPIGNLACWSSYSDKLILSDLAHSLLLSVSHLRQVRRLAYLFLHAANNSVGLAGMQSIRRGALQLTSWREALRERAIHRALHKHPFMIYGEDATTFAVNRRRRWIFDTTLLNHLTLQLRPAVVDRLIAESGLILAHCYLGDSQPHGFANCVEPSGRADLIPDFVANIEYVGLRQRQKDVVSLPFAELRKYLESFATSRLVRSERGWRIRSGDTVNAVVVAGAAAEVEASRCDRAVKRIRDHVGYLCLTGRAEWYLEVGGAGGGV